MLTGLLRKSFLFVLMAAIFMGACAAEGQGQVVRDSSSSGSSSSAATATSAPANSLSRMSVSLLGEVVETGFEAVFVSMYDARDRPSFYEGTMQLEFRDQLDDVIYSKLLTVTSAAKWGPTLDGSEGAMLKIPVDEFSHGFPGPIFVDVTFNGENGSATASHTEDSFSLTSIPQLEGAALDEKINSIWIQSKTDIDSEEIEIDGGFWGDSFSLKLESYGCSYLSSGFGVSESQMFRVDVDVLASGAGVSDIYLPSAFLDIQANALVEHDGFYGESQLSVRGGSSATGAYVFDVEDCGKLESAVFIVQDDDGDVLIERNIFESSDRIVSDVSDQPNPTATSAPTVVSPDPTASPVPTTPPLAGGSNLSRVTVNPLGELIESGFETLFLSMYDRDGDPTFEEVTVTVKYIDRLGKTMYESGLVSLGAESQWGPTLDGSDGAAIKIPLTDFSPGFPGPVSIIVTTESSDGSVILSNYEPDGDGLFSLSSAPLYEGQELAAAIEEEWAASRSAIEDITTGEYTAIEGLFSSDVYEISPVWIGCSWVANPFGGTPSLKTRIDLNVRTTVEGVHEIYLPSAYVDTGGGQLLEPDLFSSVTNLALRKGDIATATYYVGSDGCLTGDITFIQENHSGEIVIESLLTAG